MTSHDTWTLFHLVLNVVVIVWQCTGIARMVNRDFLHRELPRWINRIFFEVRPFIPALAVGTYLTGALANNTPAPRGGTLLLLCVLASWWASRHDHDDRWKKRRHRVTAKVAKIGAKLHVVPVKAGA